jgi:hypothetical protein
VTAPMSESTLLIWYCQSCRKACKIQPPTQDPTCKCANPVPNLRPTKVTETVIHTPKQRPMHALDDEEARLRALARKGTKVRVIFEAEMTEAIQWSSAGRRGIDFIVTSPDGRRHTVNTSQPGLRIEAIPADEDDG